jgi:hypothetical protein
MAEPTDKSMLEQQLDEMKQQGLPVFKGVRSYHDNQRKTSAFNAKVLKAWLPKWIRNAADNYNHISGAPSLGWLRASAKGLPVIVCGIGPSLDDDIPALRMAQNNAIIVATDAAVRPLLAGGVKPHLAVNFDCKQEQATLFSGLDRFTRHIPLLANSCLSRHALDAWAGPKLFFNMQHVGVEFMDVVLPTLYPEFGQLSNHGTVGNTAILLAYQMGAKTILLSGMDLCYRKDGDGWRYRCTDYQLMPADPNQGLPERFEPFINKVLYENSERMERAYEIKIGDKVFMVDDALDKYRQVAVSVIGSIGTADVIDCSRDGVLKAVRVRNMTLQAALEEFAIRDIEPGEATVLHLPRLLSPRADDAKGA